jgi:FkbH-like protein
MKAEIRPVDEADMLRVVQLLAKTNQFNLTTRRHSEDTVRGWSQDPRSILLTLRVSDCFGDHGLVGLILGVVAEDDTVLVDTLLMSCRVIGRTVEQFLWNTFVSQAVANGFRKVRAEYIPTAKNAQVAELYPNFGLVPVGGSDGTVVYEADLESPLPLVTFVEPA